MRYVFLFFCSCALVSDLAFYSNPDWSGGKPLVDGASRTWELDECGTIEVEVNSAISRDVAPEQGWLLTIDGQTTHGSGLPGVDVWSVDGGLGPCTVTVRAPTYIYASDRLQAVRWIR